MNLQIKANFAQIKVINWKCHADLQLVNRYFLKNPKKIC
jgi:hypothetical protein